MNAAKIARKAPGPAVAVDRDNRILAVNRAFRRLLGFSARRSLVGQSLFRLVKGRDVFGNRLSDRAEGFWQMVALREPVSSFEISVKTVHGDRTRVAVHVIVVLGQEDGDDALVYLLSPVLFRRKADEAIERILAQSAIPGGMEPTEQAVAPADLTPRQVEVLRLLSRGASVDEIAGALGISVHTVRTHLQRTFEILGVHSQVEAVARAFRDRLI